MSCVYDASRRIVKLNFNGHDRELPSEMYSRPGQQSATDENNYCVYGPTPAIDPSWIGSSFDVDQKHNPRQGTGSRIAITRKSANKTPGSGLAQTGSATHAPQVNSR